jgi:hypothetical protein
MTTGVPIPLGITHNPDRTITMTIGPGLPEDVRREARAYGESSVVMTIRSLLDKAREESAGRMRWYCAEDVLDALELLVREWSRHPGRATAADL